ncbi:hypothetical protein ACJJTC_005688 [Scirpophaga incertulas]
MLDMDNLEMFVPESISHSYVSNERPPIPSIPIEYEGLGSGYEKATYKGHAYEPLQFDVSVLNKQTNEGLKQQCEKALHELNQLRRQHNETSRRCEHVMKELEYFRGQHRAVMTQLEVSAKEASSLRGKYGDLLNDNQRLELEVQHLQQSSNPEGSSDALVHTLRKHEALKEEFECCQKRFGIDIVYWAVDRCSEHSSNGGRSVIGDTTKREVGSQEEKVSGVSIGLRRKVWSLIWSEEETRSKPANEE